MKSLSSLAARVLLAATAVLVAPQLFAFDDAQHRCHWYQLKCDQADDSGMEGLPVDAPHDGTLITVDVARNRIYLFQDGQLVDRSPVATGSESVLKKAGRTFVFHTPRGRLTVLRKVVDPIWTKPDWAFIEDGEPVPPPDSPKRQVKGHLGKYALDLGEGIMIHGTDDVGSFGKHASHGCIRVPGDMLETVYKAAKVGTPVYIFESQPMQTAANNTKTGERHSDLDF